jgi:hypothetical protein
MSRSSKTARFTSTPETAAPQQFCPTCHRMLAYYQTVFGGVSPPERWDYYECRTCGPFVYRHRTRQLRAAPDAPKKPGRKPTATNGV